MRVSEAPRYVKFTPPFLKLLPVNQVTGDGKSLPLTSGVHTHTFFIQSFLKPQRDFGQHLQRGGCPTTGPCLYCWPSIGQAKQGTF